MDIKQKINLVLIKQLNGSGHSIIICENLGLPPTIEISKIFRAIRREDKYLVYDYP
jgi:hypothetical protein